MREPERMGIPLGGLRVRPRGGCAPCTAGRLCTAAPGKGVQRIAGHRQTRPVPVRHEASRCRVTTVSKLVTTVSERVKTFTVRVQAFTGRVKTITSRVKTGTGRVTDGLSRVQAGTRGTQR